MLSLLPNPTLLGAVVSWRQRGMFETGEKPADDISLFGSWMERGWWWNGWWKKWAGQHWCHQYLWWSAHDLVWLKAIHLSPVKSMSGNKWRNCSLLLNHPELAERRKNHFVTVGWVKLQVWRVKPLSVPHRKSCLDGNVLLNQYVDTKSTSYGHFIRSIFP